MTHPTITKELAVKLAREACIEFQEHEGITGKISCTTRGSQPVERIQALAEAVYKLGRNAGLEDCKEIDFHQLLLEDGYVTNGQAFDCDCKIKDTIESLKDNAP